VAQARCELAAELLADIRHLDAQRREVKKKLAAAVTASGTSLTEVSGVGPVIAATVIGDVITVARFPSRDHLFPPAPACRPGWPRYGDQRPPVGVLLSCAGSGRPGQMPAPRGPGG
jgi:hypothetical protein